MYIDLLNEHVLKILITAKDKDSISAISRRIKVSYGWTYHWISKLIKEKIFIQKGYSIYLNKKNKSYIEIITFLSSLLKNNISLNYSIIDLFGLKYAFTGNDAVFIWTKGGYNIERWKNHYPIFIKTRKKDKELWNYYFKKLNITNYPSVGHKGIYFVFVVEEDFIIAKNHHPFVIPLLECVVYMKKNIFNFEPALEMVNEMYHLGLNIKYKEVSAYV